jgi:hypothetical protein
MIKRLCWEEKSNGRYCKNYRQKGRKQCMHHNDDAYVLKLLTYIMFMGAVTFLSFLVYNKVYTNINIDVDILMAAFREYTLQLYKLDKSVLSLYLKSLLLISTRYYTIISFHITKLIN